MPNIVYLSEALAEIDGKLRIEAGYARKTAVATPDILKDSVTKEHYVEGAFDAVGRVIEMGKDFSYLDYYGPAVYWVYKLDEDGFWQEFESFPTQAEAVLAATALLS